MNQGFRLWNQETNRQSVLRAKLKTLTNESKKYPWPRVRPTRSVMLDKCKNAGSVVAECDRAASSRSEFELFPRTTTSYNTVKTRWSHRLLERWPSPTSWPCLGFTRPSSCISSLVSRLRAFQCLPLDDQFITSFHHISGLNGLDISRRQVVLSRAHTVQRLSSTT